MFARPAPVRNGGGRGGKGSTEYSQSSAGRGDRRGCVTGLGVQALLDQAAAYEAGDDLAAAEASRVEAAAVAEQAAGVDSVELAAVLRRLAGLLMGQARYREAEPLLRRAMTIYQSAHGAGHPTVATTLADLALLCEAIGSPAEARRFGAEARAAAEPAPSAGAGAAE